jgi:hypothetical protein
LQVQLMSIGVSVAPPSSDDPPPGAAVGSGVRESVGSGSLTVVPAVRSVWPLLSAVEEVSVLESSGAVGSVVLAGSPVLESSLVFVSSEVSLSTSKLSSRVSSPVSTKSSHSMNAQQLSNAGGGRTLWRAAAGPGPRRTAHRGAAGGPVGHLGRGSAAELGRR